MVIWALVIVFLIYLRGRRQFVTYGGLNGLTCNIYSLCYYKFQCHIVSFSHRWERLRRGSISYHIFIYTVSSCIIVGCDFGGAAAICRYVFTDISLVDAVFYQISITNAGLRQIQFTSKLHRFSARPKTLIRSSYRQRNHTHTQGIMYGLTRVLSKQRVVFQWYFNY